MIFCPSSPFGVLETRPRLPSLSLYSVAGETCIGRRKKEEKEEATEVASFEFRQWLLFPRRTDGRSEEEEEEEVPSLRATEEEEGSLLIAASAVGHIKGGKGASSCS